MLNDKEQLDKYVTKMLEIQEYRKEKPLTSNELREIAYSVGMTEADWQESQKVLLGHIRNGQAHLQAENWTDALRELEEALTLNPYHEQVLYGAAVAAQQLYAQTHSAIFLQKATTYANRCLQNEESSLDKNAIELLKKLQTINAQQATQSQKKRWIWIGAGVALFVLLIGFYISIKNGVVKQSQEVEQRWAQVENVYQRRADLIPKLVNVAKAAAHTQQTQLDKIAEIQRTMNASDRANYIRQQAELSQLTTVILQNLQTDLAANQSFTDLRAQIEGAENRISVERKRYNEAVQKYNTYVSTFPQTLVGAPTKEYFQSDAVGKNSEVKF